MASYDTGCASFVQEQHGEQHGVAAKIIQQTLKEKLTQKIEKIQKERIKFVEEKVKENVKNFKHQVIEQEIVTSRVSSLQYGGGTIPMLSSRMELPLCKFGSFSQGLREYDCISEQDVPFSEATKIPNIETIPPYRFSIHLTKNERMTEEQSVVGKRKIYYDEDEGETLFCSDSDEDLKENEEVKYDFSQGEDQILRMAFDEDGLTAEALSVVKSFVGTTKKFPTDSNIQERYKYLKEKDEHFKECGEDGYDTSICLDGSLNDALEIFDHFFCRRCLIFDCPLHERSQPLIYPDEKQPIWSEPEGDRNPCSDHCYLMAKDGGNEVDEMATILNSWKPLEKDLYKKGIEMFGRNSCLISRNLLNGLKTCIEVDTYMHAEILSLVPHKPMGEGDNDANFGAYYYTDNEIPSSSRQRRRKGKARKFRFSSKTTRLPPSLQIFGNGNDAKNKQYTPCGCAGMCTKECPCLLNKFCCEKYCGCSKICKNRFRGCQCSKSQCKSRQCPCFAASRECDSDVCRNCWVSCGGDGLLEEPTRHEDSQCANMKMMLRQKQRILWAKSDVAGWGAFLKNPVNKNDYIGEYTGELLSQTEADKRGKLYDRLNCSFLFDLNDKYVIDAFQKGNKLKFVNHSFQPNCYAKILLVAGDHRVGIFAKERIEAGEELFYNYSYSPNNSPQWFRKLLAEKSKSELVSSHGKGKKN